MNTSKTITETEETEKKEASVEKTDTQAGLKISEGAEEQKSTSDIMALLQVLRFPASIGPKVVTEHSTKASCIAIAVQALVKGFFVLCFYHGMNQKILRAFVNFANSISNGLRNMSEELIDLLAKTVIFNISKVPLLGEPISKVADKYLSGYLTLLATSFSTATNDILYDLYPAVSLPEGIGFLMGVLASLIGVGLSALVLKLFLVVAKHPFKSFPEIFSLLSIRSVVSIPIVFVVAILSVFLPMTGAMLLPLAALFGMSYMFSVLFNSNNRTSENRFVYVVPFIIILMLIISVLTSAIEGLATGASIYARLEAFFQTLQSNINQ
ncbi:MAG: hypothetical protein K6G42_03545 [Lachnospiraceae bacterium]|nr:hypothetical protein [Lachnospiraceae bacterium]